MRRILALGVVLGMALVFGSITLVSADCAYHKAQAAVDKAKISKGVVTTPIIDKTVVSQLQTTQPNKPAKSTLQIKK